LLTAQKEDDEIELDAVGETDNNENFSWYGIEPPGYPQGQ